MVEKCEECGCSCNYPYELTKLCDDCNHLFSKQKKEIERLKKDIEYWKKQCYEIEKLVECKNCQKLAECCESFTRTL